MQLSDVLARVWFCGGKNQNYWDKRDCAEQIAETLGVTAQSLETEESCPADPQQCPS
jgi:hypothetical protein